MKLIGEFLIPAGSPDDPGKFFAESFEGKGVIFRILRRSIDARNRSRVSIRYRVEIEADQHTVQYFIEKGFTAHSEDSTEKSSGALPVSVPAAVIAKKHVVIVGSGPAGLFCALRLIDYGFRVTVVERGKAVEERMQDIARLEKEGVLDTESNAVFGEGGAGTYSDGKLTTRIHRGAIGYFFAKMVEHGADEKILYEAKPHVGTDRLAVICRTIRKAIEASGSRICFSTKIDSLVQEHCTVKSVKSADEIFDADAVVLAIGHSARDTYRLLAESGITLEKKGFAVGSRIEHPVDFINRAQYGSFAKDLPAAEYHLAYNDANGRGTYSFCMCPGGYVINSSSEQGLLCVNGMSNSNRDNGYSNAALVVSVRPEDVDGDVFAAIEFQRAIERAAFESTGSFRAPALSAVEFCGQGKKNLPDTSYRFGTEKKNFTEIFPSFVLKGMVAGLKDFDRKIRGFIDQGTLIGVETRTSSPVRIVRDEQCRAVGFENLYAAGEGAGYAGGIVSSAVDGIRVADSIMRSICP